MTWDDERRAEKREVMKLGQAIGYGNMMHLAQYCWRGDLVARGSGGGEKTVGPCAASTVPCGCADPVQCDWCAGCGWLTQKVKQVKDTEEVILQQPKRVPPPPDKWSIRALDAAAEGHKQAQKQIAAYSCGSDINPPPHHRELLLLSYIVFNALAAAFSEWERQETGEVQP